VSNDTLVPPINPDERDCDPMVDDLSEPDFVRRHLSVESQNLLACYDYDEDDDDSDQSSVDKFTINDPDTGSESGVNNLITDENMPGPVRLPYRFRRGPVLGGPLVYVAGTFSKWTSLTQTFLLSRGRSPHYFSSNFCQKSGCLGTYF
jgi:hypothetical protein